MTFLSEDWWTVIIGETAVVSFLVGGYFDKEHIVANATVVSTWKEYPWYYFSLSHGHDVALAVMFVYFFVMTWISQKILKKNLNFFGFLLLFILSLVSNILGMQVNLQKFGIGTPVWCIILGILFRNLFFRIFYVIRSKGYQVISEQGGESPWVTSYLPEWVKPVAKLDEFFIKISLVLLVFNLRGSGGILLRALLASWIDTPIVMLLSSIFGIYVLRLTFDESLILSSALSICGTSAANAISDTIGGNKQALEYSLAIMSFFTVPLIPIMPLFAKFVLQHFFKWNEAQCGSWIGGSIDTTGAVIASAEILSDEAKQKAAIVKMLQNSLIGVFCLVIIPIQNNRKKKLEEKNINNPAPVNQKELPMPIRGLKLLWDKFPKFVLGFFLSAILASTIISNDDWKTSTLSGCSFFSSWAESIGFVAIGLNIDLVGMFRNLRAMKMILLYIIAQIFDCFITALAAYFAFK